MNPKDRNEKTKKNDTFPTEFLAHSFLIFLSYLWSEYES